MKVTVTRSGGFAGITRVWSVTVTNPDEEDEWRELVERLPWDRLNRDRADPAAIEPDRYIYRVRCARNEATIPERHFTGPWKELLERVRAAEGEQ
ncbi:MAG: hypothetical protein JWP30_1106 [Homoserinimonas sp.]|nr:hypothetical protein [Homoserinimonas sp.]